MLKWQNLLNKYQRVKEFHLLARAGCKFIFISLKYKIPHCNPTKGCLLLEFNGKQSEYLKVNILRKLVAKMFGIFDKFSSGKKSTIEVFCCENDLKAKLWYHDYDNYSY